MTIENERYRSRIMEVEKLVLDEIFQMNIKVCETKPNLFVYFRGIDVDAIPEVVSKHLFYENWLIREQFPIPAPVLSIDTNVVREIDFSIWHIEIMNEIIRQTREKI